MTNLRSSGGHKAAPQVTVLAQLRGSVLSRLLHSRLLWPRPACVSPEPELGHHQIHPPRVLLLVTLTRVPRLLPRRGIGVAALAPQWVPRLLCPSPSWLVLCDKDMMALPRKTGFFFQMGTGDFKSGFFIAMTYKHQLWP